MQSPPFQHVCCKANTSWPLCVRASLVVCASAVDTSTVVTSLQPAQSSQAIGDPQILGKASKPSEAIYKETWAYIGQIMGF